MLRKSTVKEIDRIASQFGMSRSLFMAHIIEGCIENLIIFEQSRNVNAVKISEKVIRKITTLAKPQEQTTKLPVKDDTFL